MIRTAAFRTAMLGAAAGVALVAVAPQAFAQSRSLIPAETLEVMLQRQDAMFTRMDLNRDNAISSTEIQVAMAQMRAQRGQGGGQGGAMGAGMGLMLMFGGPAPGGAGGQGGAGGPGGPGAPGAPGGPDGPRRVQLEPAQIAERMIQSMDKDGDSQISRAEMRAAAETRFKAMDRNGDGVLSEDEQPRMRFQGGPGAMGGQGGGMTPPVEIPTGDGF